MTVKTALIDAGVLAAPLPDDEPSQVYEYVESLLQWKGLLDEPWIAVRLREQADEALLEAGLLPFRHTLQKTLDKYRIKDYDANTIAPVFEKLLSHTPRFETHFKIRDVEYDNFSSNPDLSDLRSGSALTLNFDNLERFVVLIAVLEKHCDASLIVKSAPDSGEIELQACIHKIDHGREDLEDVPCQSDVLRSNVVVCDNFSDLLVSVDETRIWTPASDSDSDFETALQLTIFKHRLDRGIESEWPVKVSVDLGSGFIESVKKCCEGNWKNLASKTLHSIAEAVEGIDMRKSHSIRKSKGGGSSQRERSRDGAKAWRRDIDYEYHLHYWKKGEEIELASVVTHNDFSIPE